jgi:hypothetical protein
MSKLVTTSLLDAIDWCKSAPSTFKPNGETTWKEDAYLQLKATLGREPWKPTPAIVRGIDFENSIYSILKDKKEDTVQCSDAFRKVLYDCKGGEFQKRTKTIIEMDGVEYCLYGKIDVFFPDKIIDIKTTGKYGGRDKYLGTSQHHIYCFGENIHNFEYIILEFVDEGTKSIRGVHHVTYESPGIEEEEKYIKGKIQDMLTFLENYTEPGDLKELYNTTYCRY